MKSEIVKLCMREIKKITDNYEGRSITNKIDRDLFRAWFNLLYLLTEGITLQEAEETVQTNIALKQLKNALKKSPNEFIKAVAE